MTRLAVLVIGSTLLCPVSGFGQSLQFSIPDSTLRTYIAALRAGDARRAGACFDPPERRFYLPRPVTIDSFTIEKRTTYGVAEAAAWKARPAATTGDVELQVLQWQEGSSQRFTYLFRRVSDGWKIIAHSAWTDEP